MSTTYFKPLRRKIGILTLGLACVFMAGWVRSLQIPNYGSFQSGTTSIEYLQSYQGDIVWQHLTAKSAPEASLFEMLTEQKFETRFMQYGIRFSTVTSTKATGFSWRISYWPIAIPLTVLSAWLLFSKPRGKQPGIEP